jgi:hypothetical protein
MTLLADTIHITLVDICRTSFWHLHIIVINFSNYCYQYRGIFDDYEIPHPPLNAVIEAMGLEDTDPLTCPKGTVRRDSKEEAVVFFESKGDIETIQSPYGTGHSLSPPPPPYGDDEERERAGKRAKRAEIYNENDVTSDIHVGNNAFQNTVEMVVCTDDNVTSDLQNIDKDNEYRIDNNNDNEGNNNSNDNNSINSNYDMNDNKANDDSMNCINDSMNCINDSSIVVPNRSHKKRRKEESYTGVGLTISRLIDLDNLLKSGLKCSNEMWEVFLIVANMNDNQSHDFIRTNSRYSCYTYLSISVFLYMYTFIDP